MSKDPHVNSEGVLEQLLRIVRRRKWIVLQATIAVPLMALVLSLRQEEEYTATATLLFRETPSALEEGEDVIDPTREAATNGQLVGLPVVAAQAADELDGGRRRRSPRKRRSRTEHESRHGEDLGDDRLAELSAEMANAYGDAYISFRREADRSQVQDAIDVAEESLEQPDARPSRKAKRARRSTNSSTG